jgi:hypothetical protein
MASVAAQLKELRQQVEKLQVEVAGRQSIGAMVVWDGQNESSVHGKYPNSGDFQGLVIHLTPELSPLAGTAAGIGQNALNELKAQIRESLAGQSSEPVD